MATKTTKKVLLDDEAESLSGLPFLFTSPIEMVCPKDETHDIDNEEINFYHCYNLVSILIFNLAMAHHLLAMDMKSKSKNSSVGTALVEEQDGEASLTNFLKVALRLYELSHEASKSPVDQQDQRQSQSCTTDVWLVVAIFNNVAEIHSEFRNDETARQCSERLLQTFMYLVDNQEFQMVEKLDGVLSNVVQRLLLKRVVAPAA